MTLNANLNNTWQYLPKELRDKIKEIYHSAFEFHSCYSKVPECYSVIQTCLTKFKLLEEIFGKDNLISNTELSELLFVGREKVVEKYNKVTKDYAETGDKWCSGYISALNDFFGGKCLPDKKGIDLNELNKKLDEALEKETSESLNEWIDKQQELIKISAADSLIAMAKDEMDINDKEPSVQGEPKFKVGDKAKVVENNSTHSGEIVTLVRKEYDNWLVIDNSNDRVYFRELDLEPYTEPETKDNMEIMEEYHPKTNPLTGKPMPNKKVEEIADRIAKRVYDNVTKQLKDNMEEKELNLVELLKGCEGETFYSLIDGEVKLKQLTDDVICQYHKYHRSGYLLGCALDGVVMLYPSRALYEKYPLDAYSAWMEWKSERTPKRWRAEYRRMYWYVPLGSIIETNMVKTTDLRHWIDDEHYELGNYFKDEQTAKQAYKAVRETLLKIHENQSKQ